jgi:hypothetical protein
LASLRPRSAAPPLFSPIHLNQPLESHFLLDLRNRQTWVQTLRTRSRAVQNGMTSVQTHRVIHSGLPLLLLRISAIRQPPVTLHQYGGAEVLLRVPPIRWAGGGAAGAENTFVETIQLLAFLLGLQIFLAVRSGIGVL